MQVIFNADEIPEVLWSNFNPAFRKIFGDRDGRGDKTITFDLENWSIRVDGDEDQPPPLKKPGPTGFMVTEGSRKAEVADPPEPHVPTKAPPDPPPKPPVRRVREDREPRPHKPTVVPPAPLPVNYILVHTDDGSCYYPIDQKVDAVSMPKKDFEDRVERANAEGQSQMLDMVLAVLDGTKYKNQERASEFVSRVRSNIGNLNLKVRSEE